MLLDTLGTLTQLESTDCVLALQRGHWGLPVSLCCQLVRSHVLLPESLQLLELDHVLSHSCYPSLGLWPLGKIRLFGFIGFANGKCQFQEQFILEVEFWLLMYRS